MPWLPGVNVFLEEAKAMSTTQLSEAAIALKHSPHPALRGLHIEQLDDKIILKGRVPSYYLKQLAQETVMAAYPGQELVNEVTVGRQ